MWGKACLCKTSVARKRGCWQWQVGQGDERGLKFFFRFFSKYLSSPLSSGHLEYRYAGCKNRVPLLFLCGTICHAFGMVRHEGAMIEPGRIMLEHPLQKVYCSRRE